MSHVVSASPACLACRSLLSGRQAALLAQQQAAALEAAPGQGSQRSRLHQGGAGGLTHWPLTDAELLALALMNAMRGSSRKRAPQRSNTDNYMSKLQSCRAERKGLPCSTKSEPTTPLASYMCVLH